ncbi:glycosidase [Streptomyces sp. SID335]|nr:glycosidase [Streptomyces sp. SID335]MYZ13265.1 glycosidase [Streptomyces sp. SID337]NDZ85208.1 glycosidase [Streptomyces sp. SID10115]NEA03038.1 glycosidase [Streptomyces sp. SID10116]NEB48554.1 glycosidase [Streptomyces sp. SID339]
MHGRISKPRRIVVMSTALVAGAAGSLSAGAQQPGQAAAPAGKSRAAAAAKDVTAVMFEWNFDSVAKACTDTLGPAGYGYVQTSPPQERLEGPSWWTAYQPVSYKIASRLGDRASFKSMVDTCHDAGVKVVADTVINHMTNTQGTNTGSGGTRFSKYDYPGTYGDADMDNCKKEIQDYTKREESQNCELGGLADLDTGEEHVRTTIAGYMNDLLALGVDGFRIDAAKHMPEGDLKAIKSQLTDPDVYWKQETLPGPGEEVQPGEYIGTGDVQEFNYAYALKGAFESGSLAGLKNIADGKQPSENAGVFVANHDTERQGNVLTYKQGAPYTLAHVFALAFPYGSPDVHSGYAFDSKDDGPPADGRADCSGDAWVCQHAQPKIASMVAFRNTAGDAPLTDWWDNGGGAIAFGRGDKAFVAVNAGDGEVKENLRTSLPAGEYCDVQSGKPVTVDGEGRLAVTVAAKSAVALHVGAKSCPSANG